MSHMIANHLTKLIARNSFAAHPGIRTQVDGDVEWRHLKIARYSHGEDERITISPQDPAAKDLM